ncbi:MAG: cytochrome c biogenesis protein CcsA [Gammaproteobacteria bacterium]|nr:cytochrome c biogenesis protein CcsA [Gammaproteobacteria bacterium]
MELTFLYLALACYSAFGGAALFSKYRDQHHKALLLLAITGLILHSTSITIRWIRIEHGPFINLYEILTSNVWSLSLGITLFLYFFRRWAIIFYTLIPVIFIMMLWLLTIDAKDTFLPPTYNTVWLYYHVISGKLFFTLLFLATGLAVHSLRTNPNQKTQTRKLAYKFLAVAFIAESFMLLFGAIWAQDAWGRYWAWDPLETWAFLTWLALVFTLHYQINYKRNKIFGWLIVGCFIMAFLTFYGVPFISTAPHKGMI